LTPFSFRANRESSKIAMADETRELGPASILKNSSRRPPVRQENVRLSAARPPSSAVAPMRRVDRRSADGLDGAAAMAAEVSANWAA